MTMEPDIIDIEKQNTFNNCIAQIAETKEENVNISVIDINRPVVDTVVLPHDASNIELDEPKAKEHNII